MQLLAWALTVEQALLPTLQVLRFTTLLAVVAVETHRRVRVVQASAVMAHLVTRLVKQQMARLIVALEAVGREDMRLLLPVATAVPVL